MSDSKPSPRIDPDALELFRDIKAKRASKITALLDLLRKQDPKAILSHLAVYFVSYPENMDPETDPKRIAGQVEAELVQALTLTISEPMMSRKPSDGPEAMAIAKLAREIVDDGMIANMLDPKGEPIGHPMSLIRNFTSRIRNIGYPQDMLEMAARLYGPFDSHIQEKYGLTVTQVLGFIRWIAAESDRRLNDHRQRVREVIRKKGKQGMLRAFRDHFPSLANDCDGALNEIELSLSPAKCRRALWGLLEGQLPLLHTFTMHELSQACGAREARVENAFARLSFKWGELKNTDATHVLITNPVHARPLIRDGDDYYFPVVGILYHQPWNLIESLLLPELTDQVEKRRADFLEEETARLVESAFPKGTAHSKNKYDAMVDGVSIPTENDITLIYGRTLFIIECKSGRVSDSARRGGELRLREKVNELIVEPGDQVNRLRKTIQNKGTVHLESADGVKFTLRVDDITHTIGLSIYLEDALGLMIPVRELTESGLVDRVPDPPVLAMSLHDLGLVLQCIPTELERVHYFLRRLEWELGASYFADESDLLAYYLRNGLNFAIPQGITIGLAGWSKELDSYFELPLDERDERQIPSPRIGGWWQQVIRNFGKRVAPTDLNVGLMLAAVPWEKAARLEETLRDRSAQLQKGTEEEYPVVLRYPVSIDNTTGGIVVMLVRPEDRNIEAESVLFESCLAESNWDKGVCMTLTNLKDDRPYERIAMYSREHRDSS